MRLNLSEFSDEMLDRVMAVNVRVFGLRNRMSPLMQKRGGYHNLLCSGVRGSEMLAPYVTSKHVVVNDVISAAAAASNKIILFILPTETE